MMVDFGDVDRCQRGEKVYVMDKCLRKKRVAVRR